jgi:FHA domain
MPRLVVTDGRTVIGTYPVRGDAVQIGRSTSADVPLDDLTVSRRHAEIRCTGASYFLANLAGQNGVFVQGRWIDTHQLHAGDVFEISRYRLRFEATDAERAAEAQASRTAEDSFRLTRDEVQRAVGGADPDAVVAAFELGRRERGPNRLDSRQETHAMVPAEMERAHARLTRAGHAQLRAVKSGGLRTMHLEDDVVRIGRDPSCQVPIEGGLLSSKVAAEIRLEEGRYRLVPVGGKVVAGGAPLKVAHALRDQEFFEVDGVRFQFLDRVEGG